MVESEAVKIIALLKCNYPHYYNNFTKEEMRTNIELWARIFENETYKQVESAVLSFIATDKSGYPPAIGLIKDHVFKLTNQGMLTDGEAWNLVAEAIKNSGYNSEKEFEKLPAVVQETLGSSDTLNRWSRMESDTVHSVVASNFRRDFRAMLAKKEYQGKLPTMVKEMITEINIKKIN